MITRTFYTTAVAAVLGMSLTVSNSLFVNSFSPTTTSSTRQQIGSAAVLRAESTTTALFMGRGGGVRTRGLEQRKEGPTPTDGGMILYLKAAEDGKSVGDCPFAQYIRMILEEKGLRYDVQPCSREENKPNWLLDHYEGKMPCLRHKKEAYVESNVIAAYLDYFFTEKNKKKQSPESKAALVDAEEALTGFFPAVAGYLKDVDGDDDESSATLETLKERLTSLENHLGEDGYLDQSLSSGDDDDDTFNSLDCRLVPQLYHLQVGIEKFKNGRPNLETQFPNTHHYLTRSMERSSFQNTKYSPETIEWGWNNERQQ